MDDRHFVRRSVDGDAGGIIIPRLGMRITLCAVGALVPTD